MMRRQAPSPPRQVPDPNSLLRLARLVEEVLEGTPAPETVIDENLARFAVERHQVGPLLYVAASNGRHPVSPAVLQFLNASYCDSAERREAGLIRLHRISRHFAERQISWMVFKGGPQAQQLYADPAWRSSADIDLLVSSHDFAGAFDALLELGYVAAYPPLPRSRLLRKPILAAVRDVTLIARDDLRCAIELHRRLFVVDDRRAKSLQLRLGGGVIPAPVLGPALAFYLIAHGALSLWVRLKWLVDLVPLFCKLSDEEKLESREYARRSGAENSYAASLLLLRRFFPMSRLAPLSSWLDEKEGDPAVRRRLERYCAAISLEREAKQSPFENALVALQSNWLFFEAASARASLLISAPSSSLMRRLAGWSSTLVPHSEP